MLGVVVLPYLCVNIEGSGAWRWFGFTVDIGIAVLEVPIRQRCGLYLIDGG